MTPRTKTAMDGQLKRFKEKFGREPGPGDPVFIDPNADTPKQLNSLSN
jgi:hypothetical protein